MYRVSAALTKNQRGFDAIEVVEEDAPDEVPEPTSAVVLHIPDGGATFSIMVTAPGCQPRMWW